MTEDDTELIPFFLILREESRKRGKSALELTTLRAIDTEVLLPDLDER